MWTENFPFQYFWYEIVQNLDDVLRLLSCSFVNSSFASQMAWLGLFSLQIFLTPLPQCNKRWWSLSGFKPTSVSRVAPDWGLSDALQTELQWCSFLCNLVIFYRTEQVEKSLARTERDSNLGLLVSWLNHPPLIHIKVIEFFKLGPEGSSGCIPLKQFKQHVTRCF